MGWAEKLFGALEIGESNPTITLLVLGVFVLGALVNLSGRLFLFYRQDRFYPKIEFLCDALFKVEREDAWIAEIVCVVRNCGVTGHRVRDLSFRVHGLRPTDPLVSGDKTINGQINFPETVHQGRWKLRPDMNVRVEPGTAQFYRHVAKVPKKLEAIVVHGSMVYRQKRTWWLGRPVTHTCNRLIRIPHNLADAAEAQGDSRLELRYIENPNGQTSQRGFQR